MRMMGMQTLIRGSAILAVVVALAAPAGATTLMRTGLDDLVAGNETIVIGQVTGLRSYWNAERTFILTDVRVKPTDVLKGRVNRRDLEFTVMGGTVGDLTTLIVAGPELVFGAEYLLFLNREDLPGKTQVPTVRELSQGIFDIAVTPAGRRAVSQAIHHPLYPDNKGQVDPPGGPEGFVLDELVQKVRELTGDGRQSRRNQ